MQNPVTLLEPFSGQEKKLVSLLASRTGVDGMRRSRDVTKRSIKSHLRKVKFPAWPRRPLDCTGIPLYSLVSFRRSTASIALRSTFWIKKINSLRSRQNSRCPKTFSNAFSSMKMLSLWFKFQWNFLFPIELTINHNGFR